MMKIENRTTHGGYSESVATDDCAIFFDKQSFNPYFLISFDDLELYELICSDKFECVSLEIDLCEAMKNTIDNYKYGGAGETKNIVSKDDFAMFQKIKSNLQKTIDLIGTIKCDDNEASK